MVGKDSAKKGTEVNITVSGNYSGGFLWSPKEKEIQDFKPERVIVNDKTTILFWKDGSKQIVRCGENDVFDIEHGVAMAIAHKMFGAKNQFKKFVKKNTYQTPTKQELEEKKSKKSQK